MATTQVNEGDRQIFRVVGRAGRSVRRYRSARVPARQDGALQRLKATSLSALLAHFSTDSAGGEQHLEAAGDVASGAGLADDQQAAAVGREPGRLDVADVGIGRGGGEGVEAPAAVGGAAQDPQLGPGGERLDGQRGRVRPTAPSGARSARRRRRCSARPSERGASPVRRRRLEARTQVSPGARGVKETDRCAPAGLLERRLGRPARGGHAHRGLLVEIEILGRQHPAIAERQLPHRRRLGAGRRVGVRLPGLVERLPGQRLGAAAGGPARRATRAARPPPRSRSSRAPAAADRSRRALRPAARPDRGRDRRPRRARRARARPARRRQRQHVAAQASPS